MRFLYVSVMFIIVLCDFNMCSGFKRKLFFLSKSSFVFWCFNPIALFQTGLLRGDFVPYGNGCAG